MTPHGPDYATFKKASEADLKPEFFDKGLAFMFETSGVMKVSQRAMEAQWRDKYYFKCWEGIPRANILISEQEAETETEIETETAGGGKSNKKQRVK